MIVKQDQTKFEGLHAQECTHMNDIAECILFVSRFILKKIDLQTRPIFKPKGQTNL